MTEVLLVCSKDGCFKSVSASGHAGFASKGKDIVCAAESMLLRTAMEVLEQTENVALESDVSERGKLFFSAECKDSSKDAFAEKKITLHFPDCKVESWRSYNRTFFGALRIEKVVLMMLVFLIFVVVSVNIYNGMRRMVFERKEEIAV